MTDSPSAAPAGGRRAVERVLDLKAPIDAVWRALTDAEELVRWFPLEASVTPGENGTISLAWGDLYRDAARITVWEPERRLQFAFPTEGPAPLVTDYFLEGKRGGTVLRVVTSGFGAGGEWEEQFRGVSHGWDFELFGLKHYLEHHRGRARHVAWGRGRSRDGYQETWARLVGPGGFFGPAGLNVERAGAALDAVSVTGDVLGGSVALWQPPRQIAAVVSSLGDALFRAELNGPPGAITVVLWLSTYGLPQQLVSGVGERWRAFLAERFPREDDPNG